MTDYTDAKKEAEEPDDADNLDAARMETWDALKFLVRLYEGGKAMKAPDPEVEYKGEKMPLRDAQALATFHETMDIMRHRGIVEIRQTESIALSQRNADVFEKQLALLERSVMQSERQTVALETIAKALSSR